jgi:hypothetical protein
MSLFSLQGYIRIGERLVNGRPGKLFWAGNVPEATISIAEETTDTTESFSGNRLSYGRLSTAKTGTFNLTLDEWSLKNLALGLYSAPLPVVTGSASAEAFPSGLVAGDQVRLAHPYASSLVITDSAGTPATVAAEHYRLIGHNQSIVEILNVASYMQPFNAAYTYAAYDSLEVFTQAAPERYVVFDGVNTETGDGVLVDLYRVRFSPIQNLGLIHSEYGNLPMTGAVLFDGVNVDSNGKGGFFKIRQKTAS